MTDQTQPDMSGHKPCVLCDCWNATHHSRFVTTPVQPAEAEVLMIRGFMKAAANSVRYERDLCERHQTVIQILTEMEKPVLETGMNPNKPEPEKLAPTVMSPPFVTGVPISAPTRVAMADINQGAAMSTDSARPLTLDELLPSKIPIPTQQPVFGEPLTVPCPACGAAIGSKCQVGGQFGFHKSRIEAASPEQGVSEFVPFVGDES